jgi:peptidoglycan/LPS O-acetylase OafA/YrhL
VTDTATASEPRRGLERSGSDGRIIALDGVRGVAILGIMAFHSGIPGLGVGGFFSQDAFFVLSGLVITLILLREWDRTSAIRLGAFYAARVRRLIPALLVMLIAVALFVKWVAPAGEYPGFRNDVLSVLGYFSNWHFISTGANYFARTGAPSLLTHTWSLAVEEQFYLVWPLLVIAILWPFRRNRARGLGVLLCVSLAGVLASSGWMALLARTGATQTRLYYGTDTHGQSILVGSALAVVLTMIKEHRGTDSLVPVAESRRGRWIISFVGVLAASGLAWQWTHVGNSDVFTYQGGFLLCALLTALVLASVSCAPAGPLAVALSVRWLRYLGTISYGMYLWYFPVFQYVDGSRTGQTGLKLFAIRVSIDIAIATCSFFLIEHPIRQSIFLRSPNRARRWRSVGVLGMALGLTAGVMLITTNGTSVPTGIPLTAAGASSPSPMPSRAASSLTAARGTAVNGAPTRLLLIGDSAALTLGFDLPARGPGWNAAIDSAGVEGCGVAIGALVRSYGIVGTPGSECASDTPRSGQWPAQLRGLVASDQPQIVALLAGRWETADRVYQGQWTNILNPVFKNYLRQQLRLAVAIGTSSGAHMDLLTAPCYSSGEQPDGTPWPEDSTARLEAYNDLLYQVAAEHPLTASVVNLDGIVCPGGVFHSTIDGVTIRAPDGVHFPYFQLGRGTSASPDTPAQSNAFGAWIGPRLMPELLAGVPTAPR